MGFLLVFFASLQELLFLLFLGATFVQTVQGLVDLLGVEGAAWHFLFVEVWGECALTVLYLTAYFQGLFLAL